MLTIIILALALAPLIQNQDSKPQERFPEIPPESAQLLSQDGTPNRGYRIPKKYTPAYACVVSFFWDRAHKVRKMEGRRGRLHEQGVGAVIEKSSDEVKEAFKTAALDIEEAESGTLSPKGIKEEDWEQIQADWIQAKMERTWGVYSKFLDRMRELGMDADKLHADIVAEGRKSVSISVYLGPDDDPNEFKVVFDKQLFPIYRKFEVPGDNNPYLVP